MTAFRNFIVTALIAALIFGLIAFGLIKYTTGILDSDEQTVDTGKRDDGEDTGKEVVEKQEGDISGVKGESFTMLFIGTDYQPSVFNDYDVTGQKDEHGFPKEPRPILSDVLILVRSDKESGKCVFCAIPAETEIQIDGLKSKLSELYAVKGVNALCDKVMSLTGLPIDYYMLFTAEKFKGIIDAFGGVTYYVASNMSYKDPANALDVNLKKGSQKLDGQKALDMLRFPDYKDGEASRRKTAVAFLRAMCKLWLTTANESQAKALFNQYSQYFETNMTETDVENNSGLIFAFSKMDFTEYTYPGSATGDGYFNANISKAVEYFYEYKYQG